MTTTTTLLLPSLLPADVWADTVLQMLDAKDVVCLPPQLLQQSLPPGAAFVASRVLQATELAWFTENNIPVKLLVETRVLQHAGMHCIGGKHYGFMSHEAPAQVWLRNGSLHRDDDLPAVVCANGNCQWWVNGELHRDGDLCAILNVYTTLVPPFGTIAGCREWYQHGKLHRDGDQPAAEYSNGRREWYVNGDCHRDGDRPAIECADGMQKWYQRGLLHRDGDRPAIENEHTGLRKWFQHDLLHRDGGLPAVEWPGGGAREWWVHGIVQKVESVSSPNSVLSYFGDYGGDDDGDSGDGDSGDGEIN